MSKDCKDTVQTLKTVTKRDCDAKELGPNRVTVRCGRRQSCRDQESF